jgi:hypothetical protein
MPDYDPSALNEAKARFEEHLQSSQAGAEVLEILTSRHVGVSMLPKCFTYGFSEEQRQDFERLLRPPWIDSLKDALSGIEPDLSLRFRDFGTGVERQATFRHTDTGIVLESLPEIRDIDSALKTESCRTSRAE